MSVGVFLTTAPATGETKYKEGISYFRAEHNTVYVLSV